MLGVTEENIQESRKKKNMKHDVAQIIKLRNCHQFFLSRPHTSSSIKHSWNPNGNFEARGIGVQIGFSSSLRCSIHGFSKIWSYVFYFDDEDSRFTFVSSSSLPLSLAFFVNILFGSFASAIMAVGAAERSYISCLPSGFCFLVVQSLWYKHEHSPSALSLQPGQPG